MHDDSSTPDAPNGRSTSEAWLEIHDELVKIRDLCTLLSLEMRDWIFEQGFYATTLSEKNLNAVATECALPDLSNGGLAQEKGPQKP